MRMTISVEPCALNLYTRRQRALSVCTRPKVTHEHHSLYIWPLHSLRLVICNRNSRGFIEYDDDSNKIEKQDTCFTHLLKITIVNKMLMLFSIRSPGDGQSFAICGAHGQGMRGIAWEPNVFEFKRRCIWNQG